MCNYVSKVPGSSNYQFRRKIPQDLIPHYNRKEIKKSLSTSERREAEKRSRIFAAQLDAEWDEARKTLGLSSSTTLELHVAPSANTADDAVRARYYGDEIWMREAKLVTDKVRASLPPLRADEADASTRAYYFLSQLRALNTLAIEHGVVQQFLEAARNTLAERESMLRTGDLDPNGIDLNETADVSEAMRNAYQAFLDGTGPTVWFNPVQLGSAGSIPSTAFEAKSKEAVSLFGLVDKWEKERVRNGKTLDMYRRTATRFRELVGRMSIQEIKREDVVRFKDELLKLGQSAANTKKQLIVINILLNYAKANALIERNPASGVSIKVEKLQKPRVPFDALALKHIFSSPIYSKNHRPRGGAGEAAYWLPLLALFTGARIEELGQLHPSDVMEESYFDAEGNATSAWVIRIRHCEEFGQKVKNFGSNRRVPVHSGLIRLGFLSYALEAQKEKRYRIFDKLVADKYGTETAQFSKWFGRYLRNECGVTDKRMTFHSFRHTFKDLCRSAAIAVGDQLTGHVTGSVAESYGGDRYPLNPLVIGIKKYRVLGFDFSHFKSAT